MRHGLGLMYGVHALLHAGRFYCDCLQRDEAHLLFDPLGVRVQRGDALLLQANAELFAGRNGAHAGETLFATRTLELRDGALFGRA